jgi:hypothetical protein
MKDTWMKKELVISIILLFIGVAVAPSINYTTVKASASQENDLVEVTTQACGIKGYKDATVKLTRQQYQDLEQYLIGFRARLNQTTTREEAVLIFREAVAELDKYGLLPKGMSVAQAQKLVIGEYQNTNTRVFQEKLLSTPILGNNSNYLCLIVGVTSYVLSFGFLLHSLIYFDIIIEKLTTLLYSPILIQLLNSLDNVITNLFSSAMWGGLLFYAIYNLIPLKFFSCLSFGMGGHPTSPYYPSDGWIFSLGLTGIKFWYRPFTGSISTIEAYIPFAGNEYFIGATGFTGIILTNFDTHGNFIIGTALHIAFNQLE